MQSFRQFLEMKDDPCWDGYEMIGKKKKGGKEVPNCVKKESLEEGADAYFKVGVNTNHSDAKKMHAKLMKMLSDGAGKETETLAKNLKDATNAVERNYGDRKTVTKYGQAVSLAKDHLESKGVK